MVAKPEKLAALVSKEVRKWQVAQQALKERTTAPEAWPAITISREFGSRGAAIGQLVAQRLGYSFWDKQLVHEVSKESGASESLLATLDERSRSVLEVLLADQIRGLGNVNVYARQLMQVVRTLGRAGAAVIVGRGGCFILVGEPALHVRIVGRIEERVQRCMERTNKSEAEAWRYVADMDAERAAFVREHFHADIADASNYDLIINSSRLSDQGAAELLLAAFRARFGTLPTVSSVSAA